jgi:acyl-CoA synthetase (AMP-forming)/AMP-acid ligase II
MTLRDQGIRKGAGVAMLVKNKPEAVFLQLALHLLGCRTVWIATYAPYRDQADFVRLADAEVLVYHTETKRGGRLVESLSQQEKPIMMFSLGPDDKGTDLLAAQRSRAPAHQGGAAAQLAELAGPEPESLFYTGGTTGQPKLVHHRREFFEVLHAIAAFYLAMGEPPMRFLSGSGFTHVSGQMPALLTLFEGGTLFLTERFDPAEFLATIEKERISSSFLTPALLYKVLDHPAMPAADTSSMRYLNVGGAAASPTRLAEAITKFGPVLRLVYGLSEVPLITDLPFLDHDPEHPERLSSCGKPFADIRIEIRDEKGNSLPVGHDGEVWIAGSLNMAGYWQQPDLTDTTIVDGWVRTGDVGHLDADGYLYLVDRVSDMIVTTSAALNIYARPIEDTLVTHPQVRAAAVIGVPDDVFGEVAHAFVVATPGAGVTAEQLRDMVQVKLNDLYTPRGIEFVDALPITPIGKVDKKALRKQYGARAPG